MSFIVDTFFGGAERRAAEAQAGGITQGVTEQRRFAEQTRGDFAGIAGRGEAAGDLEAAFLGLQGPEAERAAIEGFTESPGQAFLRERGIRQANKAASVSGGLGGGNILEELNRQGIGFAGQFLGERKDRLAGVANRGLSAVGQGAGIGAGISSNIAQLFSNRGQVLGQGITNQAAGRRSGLARVGGALIGGGLPKLSGFGGAATLANTPSQFGSGGGAFGLTRRF